MYETARVHPRVCANCRCSCCCRVKSNASNSSSNSRFTEITCEHRDSEKLRIVTRIQRMRAIKECVDYRCSFFAIISSHHLIFYSLQTVVNTTSSRKPEVHNISQFRHKSVESWQKQRSLHVNFEHRRTDVMNMHGTETTDENINIYVTAILACMRNVNRTNVFVYNMTL